MLQRAIFGLGTPEMVVIFGVILIFFGPRKLPELARGIGKGLREFRKASDDVGKAIHEASVEEIEAPRGSVSPKAAEPEEVPVTAPAESAEPAEPPEPAERPESE
jgi:TatA/E family protein of Tat protein translocase